MQMQAAGARSLLVIPTLCFLVQILEGFISNHGNVAFLNLPLVVDFP